MRYNKTIDSIVWWIPFKNVRNLFREILINLVRYNNDISLLTKKLDDINTLINSVKSNNELSLLTKKLDDINTFVNLDKKNVYYDNLENIYEYNNIISIGNRCFTTEILRINNKKKYSYPFDNLGFPTDLSNFNLLNNLGIIKNKFNNFFDIKDLKLLFSNKNFDVYFNKFTNLWHSHDFKVGSEFLSEYTNVSDKYNRRTNRFIKELESGNKIMLLYIESHTHNNNYINLKEIEKLLNNIRGIYNNNNIDLLFIRNNPSYPSDKIDFSIINNRIHLYIINNYFSLADGMTFASTGYAEDWIGNIPLVSKILSRYKIIYK